MGAASISGWPPKREGRRGPPKDRPPRRRTCGRWGAAAGKSRGGTVAAADPLPPQPPERSRPARVHAEVGEHGGHARAGVPRHRLPGREGLRGKKKTRPPAAPPTRSTPVPACRRGRGGTRATGRRAGTAGAWGCAPHPRTATSADTPWRLPVPQRPRLRGRGRLAVPVGWAARRSSTHARSLVPLVTAAAPRRPRARQRHGRPAGVDGGAALHGRRLGGDQRAPRRGALPPAAARDAPPPRRPPRRHPRPRPQPRHGPGRIDGAVGPRGAGGRPKRRPPPAGPRRAGGGARAAASRQRGLPPSSVAPAVAAATWDGGGGGGDSGARPPPTLPRQRWRRRSWRQRPTRLAPCRPQRAPPPPRSPSVPRGEAPAHGQTPQRPHQRGGGAWQRGAQQPPRALGRPVPWRRRSRPRGTAGGRTQTRSSGRVDGVGDAPQQAGREGGANGGRATMRLASDRSRSGSAHVDGGNGQAGRRRHVVGTRQRPAAAPNTLRWRVPAAPRRWPLPRRKRRQRGGRQRDTEADRKSTVRRRPPRACVRSR